MSLPDSPSDNKGLVPWAEREMNDLALRQSQRNNPVFRFNRHLLYNLSRPSKSLQLLAPLAIEAGGLNICRSKDAEAESVFTNRSDPDYQMLLQAVREAKKHLDEIKRFDMPRFQPRIEYVREMKRFGVLPPDHDVNASVDPYAADRAYWELLWRRARNELR
jgi:hypothetical protein